jgi:hypothetical protein
MRTMTVTLNRRAYAHARRLIRAGRAVLDDRDAWSAHQPSPQDENSVIAEHGFAEYERWHLGIDETQRPETKSRYKFPFGDFRDVHRCAVLSAESRAGQYKYLDIEIAAAHLHGMLDAAAKEAKGPSKGEPVLIDGGTGGPSGAKRRSGS